MLEFLDEGEFAGAGGEVSRVQGEEAVAGRELGAERSAW